METVEQKMARIEAENAAFKKQLEEANKPKDIKLKVSDKGGMSLYGLQQMPVTLYKEQWVRLLDKADEIRAFLKANDKDLKGKGDAAFIPFSERGKTAEEIVAIRAAKAALGKKVAA